MANEDYKNGKLPEIIREFKNTGNKYEINGMKKSIAVPFWRKGNGKFNVIPLGSYRFINEANNDYLEITSEEILQNAAEFQIIYSYVQESSKYIDDFPEINVLVTKYNELVEDTSKLFSYLKSSGMIADTLQMTKVLSQLEPLTTWYMNETGEIETLPISELYGKFQQMINTLYAEIKKLLDVDYNNMSDELRTQTDNLLAELNNLNTDLTKGIEDLAEKERKSITDLSTAEQNKITTEGTKQVKAVEDEGKKQLEIITEAGSGLAPRVENLEKEVEEIDTKFKNFCGIPIGGVLPMWNNTNPAELYPQTTWELITAGKYIQTGDTALSTGGNNSISVLKENLPDTKLQVDTFSLTTQPHTHACNPPSSNSDSGGGRIAEGDNGPEHGIWFNTGSAGGQNTGTASPSTEVLGSGTPLSIEPEYITLKFWKRLS